MPKFAVYYIPEENSELYRLGSAIVGYDVRNRKPVQTLKALYTMPHFTEQWATKASPYGFHLTIGDAIDFDIEKVATVENEVADILGCFDPKHAFTLQRRQDDLITFWGPTVVLRYDPNDYLKMLHTLIAARVHPLGTGSDYLQRHLADPEKEAEQPYRSRRIMKFFSPTIFDSYSPHFTLLNPYTGESKAELTRLFSNMFGNFQEIVIHSICLLIQRTDQEDWQICREFKLAESEWK